jgi:hypothetical protein
VYIIIISCHWFLFPLALLLLNQWCTQPLRIQVSGCSSFLIKCDIPGTAILVDNPLNALVVWFPDIFVVLLLQFKWPQ